jgi:hypothetical protein
MVNEKSVEKIFKEYKLRKIEGEKYERSFFWILYKKQKNKN